MVNAKRSKSKEQEEEERLLKLYEITVTNPRTKETVVFLGQGVRLAEAVSDGVKAVTAKKDMRVTVRLTNGTQMSRMLFRFEEDAAFVSEADEQAAEAAWAAEKQRKK